MKIQLDYKIKIVVKEGDETKEELTIFYREFTRAEKKEHEELKKQFLDIFKKAQKIDKKQAVFSKKAELHELNGEYDKALKCIESKEKLDKEIDKLDKELNDIGGDNQDAFAETSAKDRFTALVSGIDAKKLEVYADIKGYVALMRELDIAKRELEKKQSGE